MTIERGVIEYETFSGVVLHITPLSIATIQALRERAKAEYPDPDLEPFMIDIPDAVVGTKVLDEDNPEYQALMNEVGDKRESFFHDAGLSLAVEFAQPTNELLKAFEKQIEKLKRVLLLPDDISDDDILLKHVAMQRRSDQANVLQLLLDQQAITEEEIDAGLKIFRPAVSRNGLLAARQQPRGIPEKPKSDDGE